jgi:hypothetical protein
MLVQDYLRVAPLFETLDDLANSTDTMQQLLSNEWYRNHINGEQEVMIGYSDSGKDAGRMAAAWGLYEVQESLVRVAAVRLASLSLRRGRTSFCCESCCLTRLQMCYCAGVRRQTHSFPWPRWHSRARWRSNTPCNLIAAAEHSQRQHSGHGAGAAAYNLCSC